MKTIKDLTNISNVEDSDLFIIRKQNQDLNISFAQLKDNLGVGSNLIEILYSDLVNLKNNSELIPGCWYRITDYRCTTTQENTSAANNQFDILVLATSLNSLSEECKAVKHEGDTYFSNSNLDAWKIWYCLENDTHRFLWADETNGKGVIYRMIDEYNNDCLYDFKNILFYESNIFDDYIYTFTINSDDGIVDESLNDYNYIDIDAGDESMEDKLDVGGYNFKSNCNSNFISSFNCSIFLDDSPYSVEFLPNIVFVGQPQDYADNGNEQVHSHNNNSLSSCANITFGENCSNNSLSSCANITFGENCSNNSLSSCANITFGENCSNNSLKTILSQDIIEISNTKIYYEDGTLYYE